MLRPPTRLITAAKAIVLAAMVGLAAMPAQAAQISLPFKVKVSLAGSNGANTGLCRSMASTSTFGATVTFVCSTGATVDISPGANGTPWAPTNGYAYRYAANVPKAWEPSSTEVATFGESGMSLIPLHDDAFGYLTQVYRGGELFGIVDGIAGIGTITSWRVVSETNHDYLEMLVQW